jgi:hypothetical protein
MLQRPGLPCWDGAFKRDGIVLQRKPPSLASRRKAAARNRESQTVLPGEIYLLLSILLGLIAVASLPRRSTADSAGPALVAKSEPAEEASGSPALASAGMRESGTTAIPSTGPDPTRRMEVNTAQSPADTSGAATGPAVTATADDPAPGDASESGSPEFEQAVSKLTAMGFPESAVRSALVTYYAQNSTAPETTVDPTPAAGASPASSGLSMENSAPVPRVAFTVVEQQLRAQYGWMNYNAAQLIVVRQQRGLPE